MSLTEVITRLRSLNEPVPRPAGLPSDGEIRGAEADLGVPFHPDLHRYLLEASDVVHGTREPVTLAIAGSHTDLRVVAGRAWKAGVPRDWIPICEDNGDFFCIRTDGSVAFWSHNGISNESWPSLADWIVREWIR